MDSRGKPDTNSLEKRSLTGEVQGLLKHLPYAEFVSLTLCNLNSPGFDLMATDHTVILYHTY